MATTKGRKSSASRTKDIYAEITRKFLESMDNGTSIYDQPWKAVLPVSNNTGKAYSGINAITLMHKSISNDFASDRWVFVAQRKGKSIEEVIKDRFDIDPAAGEERESIMFFSIVDVPVKKQLLDDKGDPVIDERTKKPALVPCMIEQPKRDANGDIEKDADGNPVMEEAPEMRTRFIPREYHGYNLSQFENVPEDMLHPVQKPNVAFNDVVSTMLEQTGFVVKEGFKTAGIDPNQKIIRMPNKASFTGGEDMYNVMLFQQLIATTGIKGNLGRFPDRDKLEDYTDTVYDRESTKYAEEQFAGSLGAVMMTALIDDMAEGNKKVFEMQASKMKEWRFLMESDPGFLVRSSRIAQRSIDFLIKNIPELNIVYKASENKAPATKQESAVKPKM